MNRILVGFFVAILVSTDVPGCAQETETPNDPISVVQENIKAMNNKDLDKAMATIDEQSASYEQTEQIAKRLFEIYELQYELDSVRVISKTDDEARVECVQTTKKVRGPAFRDNKIDFVHTLRKVDGNWKIYNSYVKKIDYLN
jgi:serine protease Do